MKQLYIIILAVALSLASCEDWLSLPPSTATDTEDAIRTLEDARSALNGIYRLASAHSYYGDNYLYYGDCRAEDVQARIPKGSGGRVSPYYEFNTLATDNFNSTLPWNQAYKVIRQTNNLIKRITDGDVQTFDTASLNTIRAEAYVMRGLAHFDLTRMFGMPYMADKGASPGISIETEPAGAQHKPGRNTVAQCYDRVIADITTALPNLSREKTDGHINYWSAKALLSRVYLNMGDDRNAYNAAYDVIENNGGRYKLYTTEEYPTVWGKDFQSESLFEFYFTMSEPAGGSGGEGAPMVYADMTLDWNNLILTEAFLNLLNEDPDDIRHSITKMPLKPEGDTLPVGSAGKPKYLGKYPGKTGEMPQDNNLCIIRLSEVYLNAAEAGMRLGGAEATQGLAYLNRIVSRANPAKSVSEADYTIERIMKERRKELVGEGQLFFDYIRNGMTIRREGGWHLITLQTTNSTAISPTDPRLVTPIPQSEIDANPGINDPKK